MAEWFPRTHPVPIVELVIEILHYDYI
jgi:hypothetical protein